MIPRAPFLPITVGASRALTASLSDRFFADLARLGQRHATDPAHYLTVWCFESGLNPAAVNPHGGARGLNQMMPTTLGHLHAPAQFQQLTGEEQLPWIEKLITAGEGLNGGPFESAERYYHSNFFPRTMRRGSSRETVVVASDAEDGLERQAYAANQGLDFDGDGKITLGDLADILDRTRATPTCQEGLARLADAVAALPAPGATWLGAAGSPPAGSPTGAPSPSSSRGRRAAGAFIGVALAAGTVALVARRARR